ncbi:toxin Cry1Ac domain D-VI-related protein [Listeria newyorkensis]|uniref:toxin Cry1Ac domain D-VI-related protein n=1 Tax=Listeria newyorkensis TaxID=1497681 RepID=UPI0010F66841|nr:toxin Cry1Ac domain D-VI-related protein [Listeria newyorkensis]
MKKNMKKIAIALVATNVLASTVITALPPVQTHAAENKLATTLKATQGQELINVPFVGDKKLTGHIPNAAGKQITIEVSFPSGSSSQVKDTLTATVDANNNYSIDLSDKTYLLAESFGFTLRNDRNEILAARSVQTNATTYKDGYINLLTTGNNKIVSGRFKNYPNQRIEGQTMDRGNYGNGGYYMEPTTTDANGYFSTTIPGAVADHTTIAIYQTKPNTDSVNTNRLLTAPLNFTTMTEDTIVQTTVDPLTVNSTTVTGKGEPNAAIGIRNGNTSIATGTVDSNGNYSLTIAKQAGNSTITATATKASTKQTSSAETTVPNDALALAKAAVNNLFSDVMHTSLKDTTTQAVVDATSAQVNALPASADKTALQADVAKAQNILNKREEVKASIVTFYLSHDNKPVLILNKQKAANFHYFMIEDSATTSFNRSYAYIDNGIDTVGYYTTIMDKNGLLTVSGTSAVSLSNRFFMQTFTADSASLATGTFYPTAYTQIVSEAKTAVNELFISNNTANHIKDTTNQAAIDAAQAKVNLVTEATQKAELQVSVDKAQNELNAGAATISVNELFISNNPANHIKDTTNQAAIDAAQAKVNLVTDTTKKAELQTSVDKAQNELNARNTEAANQAAATASANALFIDNDPTKNIKDTTTQADINAAQALADKVTDTTKKADINKEITLAQNILNAKTNFHGLSTNANATVWFAKLDESKKSAYQYNMFVNGEYISSWYKNGVSTYSQNYTDGVDRIVSAGYAFKEGDVLTASVEIDGKQYQVGKLTISLFNNAKAAVNALFIDNDPAKNIKDTTTQAMIDAASAQVNALPASADKTAMQGNVTKAQNELNQRNAEVAAKTAVDALFIDNNTANHIKTTTDQAAIDAAQAKVNLVTNTTKKAELQTSVTKAQNELNQRNAEAAAKTAVNALFIDNNTANHIKDATNQAAIDAAQAKVNLVTDTTKKAELQGQVDKAKAELAAKVAVTAATTAVNNLFSNAPTNTTLKDSTTQAMIDAASALVNALPASTAKTALQADVAKANTLFNHIDQTTINDVTVDSTSVSGTGEANAAIVIKNGSTTIASGRVASDGTYLFNIAKQAGGSTITATVTKASNGKTSSASTTIADDSLEVATASVNALFANAPTNTILKDTTTQAMIDAASAKVDALSRNIPEKADLLADIRTADQLFNQITATTIEALTIDSVTVSGEGEPNAAIIIKNGSTTIASGRVASDGSYLFFIPKQAGGSTITATVTKASNGKISSASTTIVDDTIAQTTISALTVDSTSVSGTGEANGAVVIKNGSTTIASGRVASDGTYSFNIAKQAGGSTIIATVTKASNSKTSSASTTIVDDTIAQTTISALTADSTSVSGTGEANGNIVIKNGSTTIATGRVASDGTYLFNITKQAGGSTITATVTKASNGKTSSASTRLPNVIDYSLTANTYAIGSDELTGTYGKNISKVRLWVNGRVKDQATLNADGTYSFANVPSLVKLSTDQVEVVAVNGAYVEVARKTVTTTGSSILDTSLTPNSYAKDSATLTGTYGKDIAYVRLWVNGKPVRQAETSGRNFTFTNAASFIKNSTDLVEVVAVDAQYQELNRKTVTKTGFDTLDNSLTAPEDFTLDKDTAINGTMGTNVAFVRLNVNGENVKQAAMTAGTYTIAGANNYIKKTSDVVKIIAVNAQYQQVNSKTMTVKADDTVYDYALTPNAYTFGDATITGTYGADVKSVRLSVNGDTIKAASMSNGTFTLTGLSRITSATDLVEIVAVNSSYVEVARVAVQPR